MKDAPDAFPMVHCFFGSPDDFLIYIRETWPKCGVSQIHIRRFDDGQWAVFQPERRTVVIDQNELYEMALIGYAMKRENIEREQERIRLLLATDGFAHPPASVPKAKPAKRHLSPEGRARIIAGTKARWARYRKARKGGRK